MITGIKWIRSVTLALSLSFGLQAQDLSLDSCLVWARQNFPSFQQLGLIETAKSYTLANVRSSNLPRLQIAAQASYQSDVTSLPFSFPNMDIPQLSQDQYRIYGELNQSLTGLFTNASRRELSEAELELEAQKVEVDLHQIREQVLQVYFGILALESQLLQVDYLLADLNARQKELEGALEAGVVLASDLAQLKAEKLKVEQNQIELQSRTKAFRQMLGLMLGRDVSTASLNAPQGLSTPGILIRPELKLFQEQASALSLQEKILENQRLPQFNLFFQGGYGRPALNMLNNDFDVYYIGGLRLHWDISSFYTLSNQRKLIGIEQEKVALRQAAFVYQNDIKLSEQSEALHKLEKQIQKDQEIVRLREEIKSAAAKQLSEGTLRASDYLLQLHELARAKEQMEWHQLQVLLAQYQQAHLLGY